MIIESASGGVQVYQRLLQPRSRRVRKRPLSGLPRLKPATL